MLEKYFIVIQVYLNFSIDNQKQDIVISKLAELKKKKKV